MRKAILFDLDGTLLPMDLDVFIQKYFSLLAQTAAPYGYKPGDLIGAVWAGTKAKLKNDGTASNEVRFWDAFAALLGEQVRELEPLLAEFYRTRFHEVKSVVQPNPAFARAAVALAHEKAERVILATSPIFPRCAVESRLEWAGLCADDFDYITSYENSAFSKPNPKYYAQILSELGLEAKDCLMVGNDVQEDMEASAAVGIESYLITDCIISRKEEPLTCPHGTQEEFFAWL